MSDYSKFTHEELVQNIQVLELAGDEYLAKNVKLKDKLEKARAKAKKYKEELKNVKDRLLKGEHGDFAEVHNDCQEKIQKIEKEYSNYKLNTLAVLKKPNREIEKLNLEVKEKDEKIKILQKQSKKWQDLYNSEKEDFSKKKEDYLESKLDLIANFVNSQRAGGKQRLPSSGSEWTTNVKIDVQDTFQEDSHYYEPEVILEELSFAMDKTESSKSYSREESEKVVQGVVQEFMTDLLTTAVTARRDRDVDPGSKSSLAPEVGPAAIATQDHAESPLTNHSDDDVVPEVISLISDTESETNAQATSHQEKYEKESNTEKEGSDTDTGNDPDYLCDSDSTSRQLTVVRGNRGRKRKNEKIEKDGKNGKKNAEPESKKHRFEQSYNSLELENEESFPLVDKTNNSLLIKKTLSSLVQQGADILKKEITCEHHEDMKESEIVFVGNVEPTKELDSKCGYNSFGDKGAMSGWKEKFAKLTINDDGKVSKFVQASYSKRDRETKKYTYYTKVEKTEKSKYDTSLEENQIGVWFKEKNRYLEKVPAIKIQMMYIHKIIHKNAKGEEKEKYSFMSKTAAFRAVIPHEKIGAKTGIKPGKDLPTPTNHKKGCNCANK